MPEAAVPTCAARQFGLFTGPQAYDAGWTERQVQRRLAAGRWQVAAGRALARADLTIGPWQLAQAVQLTWADAVVSHALAGALWGFPVTAPTIGTAIVATDRKLRAPGLSAVRRRLLPGQITRLRAISVTDGSRTAVDLLAELAWDEARDLFAWLSTRGLLPRGELEVWTETRVATAGTAQLRRLLRVSAGGSLSAAEDVFHDLLRAARIAGWRANARVVLDDRSVAVVDVLFEARRVVVEIDGWSAHSGRSAFQRDRSRQNAMVGAGYLVLRFTWADLTGRPDYVIATVRQALSRGSRSILTH